MRPFPIAFERSRSSAVRVAAVSGLLLAAPILSAHLGVQGPYRIALHLGPGSTPYLTGFVPEYEVEGWSRAHWSTRVGSIQLPIAVRGGPLRLSYRFARPLSEPAVVDVDLAGLPLEHFSFPGGRFRVRDVSIPAVLESPLDLTFVVDSADAEGLGLRFDWVRFELGPRARARLKGWAQWTPAAAVLTLWLILLATGWPALRAAALVVPVSGAASFGLLTDPWLTHRLTAELPLALILFGVALALSVRVLKRRALLSTADGPVLAALMTGAFALRVAAVSHPDFYHPDLRTHARFVQVIREAGGDFFAAPAEYVLRHGVWIREAYGREYAFPYSPGFHLPLVPLPLDYDGLVTAMPIAAACWSTVPIAILWMMARRLGLSTTGALLMAFVPTYTSRLTFAFLPSLFGHAVDVGFVYWLSTRLDGPFPRSALLRGSLFISASQLAYVSGLLNVGAFALILVLVLLLKHPSDPRAGRAVATILASGSMLSVLLYYRDFMGMALDLAPRALGAVPGVESLYPIRGFIEVSYERTRSFFGGIYPVLAAAGLWLVARRGNPSALGLGAWAGAYCLLLFGRAKAPDVFLRGHEALFVTPLICLASGEALARLASGGVFRKTLAWTLFLALAAQGLYLQYRSLAANLLPRLTRLSHDPVLQNLYREGRGDILDLLDSFRTLTGIRLLHLRQLQEVKLAEAALVWAAGLDAP